METHYFSFFRRGDFLTRYNSRRLRRVPNAEEQSMVHQGVISSMAVGSKAVEPDADNSASKHFLFKPNVPFLPPFPPTSTLQNLSCPSLLPILFSRTFIWECISSTSSHCCSTFRNRGKGLIKSSCSRLLAPRSVENRAGVYTIEMRYCLPLSLWRNGNVFECCLPMYREVIGERDTPAS